ncbi:MAG: hypothetical protein A2534_04370 [Candidatus Magasanikbacteria bacterium RIFOXYD2_FULL_39_9]|uniref:Squalene cyclase C-terminal domain-containing protein n=1 Tax=Candidatus Magasanikbacteria bacterium RIFOXYD1_FULL_40_23 TaxID=1798705 RepID=A0A1F6PB88_9BACT|nr:MAG: hypothetical protein A2534_04370 [Candidatus Magasanikbacteria bacterium RIFOXYD2_FULL_39_9]OGH93422.1 MAG: hypothetical protein A2563_02330 [Candidatus Magasanikbacteria bacterium RIFOXYD1_FULL_40_23]
MLKNKLNGLKYLVILGALLWFLPALADETASSTPDTVTSTPEIVTSTPDMATSTVEITSSTPPSDESTSTTTESNIELATTSINLTVATSQETFSFPNLLVTECPETNDSPTTTLNARCALLQSGLSTTWSAYGNMLFLDSVNSYINDWAASTFWNWFFNLEYGQTALNQFSLTTTPNTNQDILLTYDLAPLKINASSTLEIGTTTTVSIEEFNFIQAAWKPATSSTIYINSSSFSNETGTYYLFVSSTEPIIILGTKPGFITTEPITLVPTTTPVSTSTTEQPSNSGGGSGTAPAIRTTEINNAVQKILNFLKSKQLNDGSIVDLQMSDWTAMAFGANGTYAQDVRTSTFSLYDYLKVTIVTSTTDTLNKCTEYSRHILGLLSSGFSKTNTQIIDLKNKIKTECLNNGTVGQAGINDDIFILMALLATNESTNSEIVQTSVNAIKTDQQESGAFTWNGWVGQDATGAAINALKYASTFGIIVDDLIFQKAKSYLHSTQLTDGGWGFDTTSDPNLTSWAMYGINALGEGQTQWTTSGNQNPWTALVSKLDNAGHYTSPWSADGIDWFATKHAVPALLSKSWPIILAPITQPSSGGSGGSGVTLSTSTEVVSIITTTTLSVVTGTLSVPPISTSTNIENENAGQILGMRIENEEPQIKITGEKIVKPKAAIKIATNLEPTTTLSTNDNQKTDEKTELKQEKNSTDSPAREMIKKLLAICLMSASAIAIYLGFKSITK